MAKTVTQIAIKVLQKLGRLPDGQVAPASQVEIVKDAYSGLYAELFNRALVDWGEADDLPEYAVQHVATILCSRIADQFGVDPTIYLAQMELSFAKLAEQLANEKEPEVVPGEYF